MTIPPLTRADPMSVRARVYLWVAASHFLAVGVTVLWWPSMYSGAVFVPIIQYTHLVPWGVAHCIVGVCCLISVLTHWPNWARVGLSLAFTLLIASSFAVGWGVVRSWIDPGLPLASPYLPLSLAALAIKDVVMVSQPLRTPFQDWTEANRAAEPT